MSLWSPYSERSYKFVSCGSDSTTTTVAGVVTTIIALGYNYCNSCYKRCFTVVPVVITDIVVVVIIYFVGVGFGCCCETPCLLLINQLTGVTFYSVFLPVCIDIQHLVAVLF